MGESINKITVVSALFYIGRDRWKHSGFPPGTDRYKSWVTNLLRQNINLYFYTDEYYYEFVLENRKKYDPNFEKTTIIKTSLDNLYFYKKYYNKEACLMASPDFRSTIFHQGSADMNYPLYHIVNFSKIELVKKSFEENKFQSDYFFWVDAGGLRNVISKEDREWLDPNNQCFNTDKITHFSHREDFTIYPDKSDYFRSQNRNIQGTAWIVPKEKVNAFYDLIDNQVATILEERIVGSDEKVYDFLYQTNRDLYQLKVGGWFEFYNIVKLQVPKRKKVFLDMGMHNQQGLHGFLTNPEVGINEEWDIYCFEPNPLVGLEDKINMPSLNINIIRKAVWTKNGTVRFGLYGPEGTSQGCLVEETGGSVTYRDYHSNVEVECLDIYEFISNLGDVDIYIKMDIEWSEYQVIEDMLNRGWPSNIKKMWVEWHGQEVESNKIRKEALLSRIGENTQMNTWI